MSDSATPWTVGLQVSLSIGLSQGRVLEWVATSFSRGPYWPRDGTCISCIGRRIFYHWATQEAYMWFQTLKCLILIISNPQNTPEKEELSSLFRKWGNGDKKNFKHLFKVTQLCWEVGGQIFQYSSQWHTITTLTRLTMVIISKYTEISNHYVVCQELT